MARKRMIDPSFWEDEKLGAIEPMARLLFMGLISQADDEGRLKGHPSLLRSNIFPYDDGISIELIESWLGLLRSLIVRYEVDRQRYIFIKNFKKHQTINKPQESKLPAPPDDYGSDTVVIPEDEGNDPPQKKLKEENLSEGEVKGKGIEQQPPSMPSTNPHEDHVLKILNDNKIILDKQYPLEQFFSYIGAVDLEVIEAAIKKSYGKKIAYCLGTLESMIRDDGITKKEHLQKSKVGESDAKNNEGFRQSGINPSEDKSITGGATGWLPSKARDNIISLRGVSG